MTNSSENQLSADESAAQARPAGFVGTYRTPLILLVVLLISCGFAVRWWLWEKSHVQTDNAYVEASTVSLSARVPGTVRRVAVRDNQFVRQGDLLVELDETDYRIRVKKAEAGLASGRNSNARILQKKAELDEARLQLSYTRLVAPFDGYVTRKSVEPGANVAAGQPLMAVVALNETWITANFKEVQLAGIRSGQRVSFTVDAFPGKRFSGQVESIMAGAGAAFSLLPPENASGNFVKVVQRIPVRIAIDKNSDPGHLLRVGMSVVPTVSVDQ